MTFKRNYFTQVFVQFRVKRQITKKIEETKVKQKLLTINLESKNATAAFDESFFVIIKDKWTFLDYE